MRRIVTISTAALITAAAAIASAPGFAGMIWGL